MNKLVLNILFVFTVISLSAQQSVHEEQLNYYNGLGITAEEYEITNQIQSKPSVDRAACNLNKVVYGWHPYWSNGLQSNYDWDLLSHLCYFSYEVDAVSGNAISTHSFSTAQAVTDALNNNVRVDLCVTLFSNHATFLNNGTAQQTLITNLINTISARGAHGVNIDFEGIPSSQRTNFANFMNNLSNQMHAAIPGSQVSTVLYAVDWNDVFDVAAMTAVDYFVIMGYDYYWTGSTNSGPNDPLFHYGSSYNYTLSKSVTYYLDKGVPANKLVLGLPYYGREWPCSSSAVPGTTTGSGTARTYTYVRNNSSGYYSAANRNTEQASRSTYYVFNNAGWRQCFISEENDLNERLDFINKRGIAGMGIWALGYDDGYNQFWDAIANNLTDCKIDPCMDSIYDIGGGFLKNYYDDEDYTFTISPDNALNISVHFLQFNLENNYDYLYIYDGPNTSAAQIPGSPFTGTTLPMDFGSSGGSLTFRFTSDVSTVSSGFLATYTCTEDNALPISTITGNTNWKTADFPIVITDSDVGSGIENKFWQVLDHNGTEWRANSDEGFFNDNFNSSIHPDWNNQSGVWTINTAHLEQSDNNQSNSNIYTELDQQNSYSYLYHWQAMMNGTGSNRRSGIHFFVDDPTLPNRGNSYFVYFRVDNNKCQIYKVVNDVFTLLTDDDFVLDPNIWYDYKVIYDPVSGKITAYVNNEIASQWIDPTPLQSGSHISLRTGNAIVQYDDVKVYRSHAGNETITVGNASSMIRYQNNGVAAPSCRIKSISKDYANNWSNTSSKDENIDWTTPIIGTTFNDGSAADIDTSNNNTTFEVNWNSASDAHSDILRYEVALGTAPGLQNISAFSSAGLSTNYTVTGIFLNFGQTYYATLRAVNHAGLTSDISNDGVYIIAPTNLPVAQINNLNNEICLNDSVQMINTSTNATSFIWQANGGSPATSTLPNPNFYFPQTGNYTITLIANGPGGADTTIENITVTIYDPPTADFAMSNDTIYLPNAFLGTTNNSLNSNDYQWSFGEGSTSTDANPWNIYDTSGVFIVELIADNGYCNPDTVQKTIVVMAAVGIDENEEEEITVFPNPNAGQFYISNESSNEFNYEITDLSGRIVYQNKITSSKKEEINVSLSSGIYLLRFYNEKSSFVKKININNN